MELKKEMYVRTKYNDFCNMVAIRKIDEFDDDGSFWIDDYIIDTYGDEQDKLHEEDVEFASEDIVNVIKPGDYVNGERVIAVRKDIPERYIHMNSKDNFIFVEYDLVNNWYYGIDTDKIKTVVTKEQFENMKYRVE